MLNFLKSVQLQKVVHYTDGTEPKEVELVGCSHPFFMRGDGSILTVAVAVKKESSIQTRCWRKKQWEFVTSGYCYTGNNSIH